MKLIAGCPLRSSLLRLRSSLLRLRSSLSGFEVVSSAAMHLLYRSNNFWNAPWKSSCVSVSITFVTASFISSIVSLRQPLSLGITKSHRDQGLGYREGEELSWCPSWSVTRMELWTGALSSSWTPLKPQHNNPKSNPNPLASQLWCIGYLTPSTPLIIDSLPSLNLLCHSNTDARFMQDVQKVVWNIPYVSVTFFSSINRILLYIIFLKCQIAFLKFTSCDNQALVGCIQLLL